MEGALLDRVGIEFTFGDSFSPRVEVQDLASGERQMKRISVAGQCALAILTIGWLGCHSQEIPTLIASQRHESQHGEFGTESIKIENETRTFRLVVPNTIDLSKPVPLVIAFHGMLIDGKDVMPKYSRLNETAKEKRFIIAFPEAVGRSWGIAPDKVKSDIAFFDALLAQVSAGYKIDPDRVFVLGMSNGGYFAHLIGKERSQTVAAVASHSGPLGLQTLLGVRADRKFPVLIIHGDEDPIFPIEFARENRDKYQREGHEVKYVELKGQGHMWAAKVNINETIWDFFAKHPRKPK